MNKYLFFYLYGAYGATYARGEGKTLKEGLKDAFDNYSCGIGGESPSPFEKKDFLKNSILISTFTEEGDIVENNSSIELLGKAFSEK